MKRHARQLITALLAAALAPAAFAQARQNSTYRYEYDAEDRLTRITNPQAQASDHGRDGLGRLKQQLAPAPVTGAARPAIKLGYDGRDQLTSVADPRQLLTTYTVDGYGQSRQQTSPDTGATATTFDGAGNLLSRTDARGKVSTYTYDALNRLTSRTFSGAPTVQYEYDGGVGGPAGAIGRLSKISDPASQTSFAYDARGRLASTVQTVYLNTPALVRTTRYTYVDSGPGTGKLASIAYPSGNRVNYGYDTAGQLAGLTLNPAGTGGVTDGATRIALLSQISYAPFGAPQSWTWGNHSATSPNLYARLFDLDGRLVAYPLGNAARNGLQRIVRYDAASRIAAFEHTGGASASPAPASFDQRFGYDNLDRLTSFTSNSGTQGYGYDASGNRSTLSYGAASYNYVTSPASNRLDSTSGPLPAKRYDYDDAGNLIRELNTSYTYRDFGQRVQMWRSATDNASYEHNGLGQRISKRSPLLASGANVYAYDEAGHLLGEYDAAGVALEETVYLGDLPVAVLKPGAPSAPNIYYVYADQINTPRVITSAAGNAIVWRWDAADPFGVAHPLENPGGGAAFVYNLRFPGQLFDFETITHYNYYRDYDPQTGRYVQSDPIGLAGGINTYSYALGNPVKYTDPTGRFVPLVIAGVCAAGGCEAIGGALAGAAIWWGLNHNKMKGPIRNDSEGEKVCPPRPDFDWNDPSVPPKGPDGTEWPWRGPDAPGGPRGGYVNPSNPDQSAHPDLNHPAPVGPHWDFTDRKTGGWRIYPDGSVRPK